MSEIQPLFDALGARLVSFTVLDQRGQTGDVVLGPNGTFEPDQGWIYFGAIVGRIAGRIANARFDVDGLAHQLEPNDAGNLLHGGSSGLSRQIWSEAIRSKSETGQTCFSLTSKDLDQGFPGTLEISAQYSWEANKWIELDITATTLRPTPVNMTQHIYWNLGWPDTETICDHLLQVHADSFLPVYESLLPTGEMRSVEQTPFDLRSPRSIGECLDSSDPQISIAKGFDHCWVLDGTRFREVAILSDPHSGRRMAVWTDQPGLQIYTANHLGTGPAGKGGQPYRQHAGIAFETQGFPDAPNHPHFPGIIVRPGELYRNRTRFVFTNESQSHLVRG